MVGALILGFRVFRTTVRDLKEGLLTTNELVAIAVLATFSSGEYHAAGLVAFFMLLAELSPAHGFRREGGYSAFDENDAQQGHRLTAKGEEEISANELSVGDRIRIRPGDNVPADGEIISGTGSLNQANITGESLPVEKGPGISLSRYNQQRWLLEVKITKVGVETEFGQVRELIIQAAQSKTRLKKLSINTWVFIRLWFW